MGWKGEGALGTAGLSRVGGRRYETVQRLSLRFAELGGKLESWAAAEKLWAAGESGPETLQSRVFGL